MRRSRHSSYLTLTVPGDTTQGDFLGILLQCIQENTIGSG